MSDNETEKKRGGCYSSPRSHLMVTSCFVSSSATWPTNRDW